MEGTRPPISSPPRNAAASALVYEIDPKEMLGVDRSAQALGADIMGVFHSHTHTDAYPSPTDVAQALDPGWHYVLVSLRDTHPVVRSYRIVDGTITEEPVVVPGMGESGMGSPGWGSPAVPLESSPVQSTITRPAPGPW